MFGLAVAIGAGVRALPAADAFVVIVHPSVAGTQVRRGDLAGLFLMKVTRWGSKPAPRSACSNRSRRKN